MSKIGDFSQPVERHKFWFQYITTPTADTPGTVTLLHFDNQRYLFGQITEGTQRACIERGISLKKARNIFLTGETKWEHNGGILGMVLTISDVISETPEEDQKALGDIVIYGGPKLHPLKVFEARPDNWQLDRKPDFVDENVQIWALPVRRASRRKSSPPTPTGRSMNPDTIEQEQQLRQKTVHDMFDSDWRKDRLYESAFKDISLPAVIWRRDPTTKDLKSTFCAAMADAPHIDPNEKVLVRLPWPAALVTELPAADNLPSSIAMSYFVKGRPQRGHFQMEKAKALGIPPGPIFGKLAGGQSITLEDGRVVNPADVMAAGLPGYGIAILDVPDIQYLPDLLAKLKDMERAAILVDVHAFLWTLGPGLRVSQEFADFKAQFPAIKHVVSSKDAGPNYLAMQSAATSAARLNRIRPETFTIPKHDASVRIPTDMSGDDTYAERGLLVQCAPEYKIESSEVPGEVDLVGEIERMSSQTIALIPPLPSESSNEKYKDVTIATLGTGSALPSKYRNVSANLLHIPSLGYFLFDAGENTLGQLKRLFSPKELEDVLCNLHMIWISHLHADHHLGTMSVLLAHKSATQKRAATGSPVPHKLYVVSEQNLADYLFDYSSIQTTDAVLLRCLQSRITDITHQPVDLKETTLPISKLDSCKVSHCQRAQAVSVTFSNGLKLSYSGDCRPSPDFVKIGKDSDVLIHEATFDDGLEGDAIAKKHSTIGEALGVANAMRAKNVILTHFSQRYQKLPTLAHIKAPQELRFEEASDADEAPSSLNEVASNMGHSSIATSGAGESLRSGSRRCSQGRTDLHPPLLKQQTSLQEAAEKMPICIAFDLMRVSIPQIKDMHKYYPAIESMFEHEQALNEGKRSTNRAANEAIVRARNKKAEEKRKAQEAQQSKRAQKKKSKVMKSSSSNDQSMPDFSHNVKETTAIGGKRNLSPTLAQYTHSSPTKN